VHKRPLAPRTSGLDLQLPRSLEFDLLGLRHPSSPCSGSLDGSPVADMAEGRFLRGFCTENDAGGRLA